ncbi:major histocompatibility complex class I-related gene protein-like isoform X2 [Carassius auratus]|uniref:Major histocompatibility complex class I-related gene protein-like isoform X2 n=1 Tax=Carassius auratus TaxID=7957 RepID=A0A6P6NTE4_CARAU|nr:major histocompatibility complex class I-related gene protein-like isoform X2 [Carassius auratus]
MWHSCDNDAIDKRGHARQWPVNFFTEMDIYTLDLVFVFILDVHCEIHHLQFVCTVFTKPDGFSGRVFSAVGLYDDRQISHYSSEEGTWKRDGLIGEIWRNTEEPHDIKVWFLHEVNTLANCTISTCERLITLQRRIGCEVDKHPDGSVINVNAFDEYRYDGEDFIAFSYDTMQWTEKSPKAKETKLMWDTDRFHNMYLHSYLKNCMDWISRFNVSISTPPALHMFTSEAPRDQSKLILTCLATGFDPKHIDMKIKLNQIELKPFSSTGVRPNDDQTFQLRTSVEINRDEKQSYECHVLHNGQTLETKWDLESRQHYWTAVAVGNCVFAVLVIMSITYKTRRLNGQMNCNGSTRSENIQHQQIP